MGFFSKKPLGYYYLGKNAAGATTRYGPYSFAELAMVYKELQITKDSYIWTNEKLFPDEKGKLEPPSEWTRIKSMPPEFVARLTEESVSALDRREKLTIGSKASTPVAPPSAKRKKPLNDPPPIPTLH